MAEQPIASQDWHTRAIIRVLETTVKHSVDPWAERTFHAGEELEMVQWGRSGRPIDRSAWWTSFDIDGAFIIESDKTEIVKILDEIAPIESEEPPGDDIESIETHIQEINEQEENEWSGNDWPGEEEGEEDTGDGSGLHQCPYCYSLVSEEHEEFCPLNPNRNRNIVP